MSVYSSKFFVFSPALVGLNKTFASDLHTEVIAEAARAAPMVGLGISLDFSAFDIVEGENVASPPMLAPRRSPRRPQVADTPGTESAPMQTPSPSLRGSSSDASAFAPSTPSISHGFAPSRAASSVGLGIDLLGSDSYQLMLSYREHASCPTAQGVGLGLSVPRLKDTELITTIEPQSTSQQGLAVDLSFLEDGIPELALSCRDSVSSDSSRASSGVGLGLDVPCVQDAELITTLEPLSTTRKALPVDLSFLEDDVHTLSESFVNALLDSPVDVRDLYANPKPYRAHLALGFSLNDDADAEDAIPSPAATSPLQRTPSLGFGSPFWTMYAAALQGLY